MVFADYHVHTTFSSDAQDSMEIMIQRAIEMGLSELALTDHVDYDSPNPEHRNVIDYFSYYPVFKAMKKKYAGEINLLLGIENGFQDHIIPEMDAILEQAPFDFALMSVHNSHHMSCCGQEYYEGVTEETAVIRYLEAVIHALNSFQNYDSLAHMSYLCRYIESKRMPYSLYREYIDEIFRLLIDNNKALEVNTSGYQYGLAAPIPDWELLERYYEAGGRLLTLGSDAHRREDIAQRFDIVTMGLRALGFKFFCTFRQREMILRPFDDTPLPLSKVLQIFKGAPVRIRHHQ